MSINDTNGFNPNVFALIDSEKTFKSDDTAWQFLKWNPEYREAFFELNETKSDPAALEKLFSHIEDPSPEMIACAQDITCRERFGIAAWVDPNRDQLPALKAPGDSWFFPLKRVEQQVSAQILRKQGQSPEKLEWYPWLTVRETPFGYGPVTRQPKFLQTARQSPSIRFMRGTAKLLRLLKRVTGAP